MTRTLMRWTMALVYIADGVLHLVSPGVFATIVPPWVPAPILAVQVTGVAALAGGVGLLFPATRRWAGIGLALYAIVVWPANWQHMLTMSPDLPGLDNDLWYHIPRQLLQPVLIWWALYCSGATDWPFGQTARSRT